MSPRVRPFDPEQKSRKTRLPLVKECFPTIKIDYFNLKGLDWIKDVDMMKTDQVPDRPMEDDRGGPRTRWDKVREPPTRHTYCRVKVFPKRLSLGLSSLLSSLYANTINKCTKGRRPHRDRMILWIGFQCRGLSVGRQKQEQPHWVKEENVKVRTYHNFGGTRTEVTTW